MPNRDKLAEFTAWCARRITGDENVEAQTLLDPLLRADQLARGLDKPAVPA